jgi:hypothetical protein
MREAPKVVSLATALAALATPAAMPQIANAANADSLRIGPSTDAGFEAETNTELQVDAELMSFTVQQTSDGMLFPQHSSHSSHASHASHASSSIPGGGYGSGPDWPSPPYVPLPDPGYPEPNPGYSSPPVESTSPTTSAAPTTPADPTALACARASDNVGMIDIASELVQVFSMLDADAVYMAQQALIAVSGGNHYCDGYLGDH